MLEKLNVDTFMFENHLCDFIDEVSTKKVKDAYKKLTIDGIEWDIDEVKYDGLNIEIVASTRKDRCKSKREK